MAKRFFIVFFLAATFAIPAWAAISRDDALHLFVKGDLAYKDGRYSEAVTFYEQILSGGQESGPLYYNLANTYFKLGKLGKAIVNYERARRLIPRDSDLQANLSFAVGQVQGEAGSANRSWRERALKKSADVLSVSEVRWVLFILFLGMAVAHISSLYIPVWRSAALGIIVVLGVVAGIVLAVVCGRLDQEKGGAVMLAQTTVKFEPREKATVYFELYEGQQVRILKAEGFWCKVKRNDGKIGWVGQDTLEKI